jgi:thiamine pyrophosphate-dependent acetolactate synthase large subunit-like protein
MAERALDRRAVVAELLKDRGELLVVTGLGSPSWDAFAAGDHDLNFYLWAGMGSAATTGLGLALAQPERPVLVLTGDGEMLMGMGALATAALKAPSNLTIAVLDNGAFGETGHRASASPASRRPAALPGRRRSTRWTASGRCARGCTRGRP